MADEVKTFLASVNPSFVKYAQKLTEQGITSIEVLSYMQDDDFKHIGVPIFHWRKIIAEAKKKQYTISDASDDNKTNRSVSTNNLNYWGTDEVALFIRCISDGEYASYSQVFKSKGVDGDKLLQLSSVKQLTPIVGDLGARYHIFEAVQECKKGNVPSIASLLKKDKEIKAKANEESTVKQKLIKFYQVYNPSKLNDEAAIDALIKRYQGHEQQLFDDLKTKYIVRGVSTTYSHKKMKDKQDENELINKSNVLKQGKEKDLEIKRLTELNKILNEQIVKLQKLTQQQPDEKKEDGSFGLKDELISLADKMNLFNNKYDRNMLSTMYNNNPDSLLVEQDINNTELSCQSLQKHLQDIKNYVVSVTKPDVSQYKSWDINLTMIWIKTLDNGQFIKYCPILRKGFESDGIPASELPNIGQSDLATEPFNIRTFMDRKQLALHFKSLQQYEITNDEGGQTAYIG